MDLQWKDVAAVIGSGAAAVGVVPAVAAAVVAAESPEVAAELAGVGGWASCTMMVAGSVMVSRLSRWRTMSWGHIGAAMFHMVPRIPLARSVRQ